MEERPHKGFSTIQCWLVHSRMIRKLTNAPKTTGKLTVKQVGCWLPPSLNHGVSVPQAVSSSPTSCGVYFHNTLTLAHDRQTHGYACPHDNLTMTQMTRKLTIQSVGCQLVHSLDHNISIQQANLGADGNTAPEPIRYGLPQVRALEARLQGDDVSGSKPGD